MKAFKELATEAKKKEMIRVKLGKKKKKIGHVITSPGKDGKPGKVLKRKGMPGKKDIGEGGDNLPTILKAFKKEWDAVKSGKEDIGSKKSENFYAALFDYFVTSGEMPYGTAKARTGDPYEWIHDRLMDESVVPRISLFKNINENLAYLADRSGKKVFVVSDRNTTGMRGTQDKFSMSVVDAKSGKLIKHIGSHPSLKGAIKYGINRGFAKKVQGPKGPASKIEYSSIKMKYNQTYTDLQKKMKYDIESVIDVGEGGFNVKGGSIPSNAEIKAFYEKQKGSHSQRIAATKKHFGLQKMTVSAKGNVSAKGVRENEGIEKEIEEMATIDEAKTMGGILRKVKKGTPPYTVVAMVRGKVVDQQTARVASQVPAIIKEFQGGGSGATDLGSKHVGDVKIAVEDKDSRVVYSEGFTRQGMTNEGKESAAYKSNRAEYDKLMKKWGSTPITKIPWKEFARIRELGDSFYNTKGASGLKVGDLLQHMKEASGGGGHPRKAPDFDERQKMYASAYRNVHKKAPSRDELRAAGVGKGFEKSFGDTSKGVKAWKAAMAALKGK